MESGYFKADVNSIPKIDFYMVQHFLSTNEKFRESNKSGKIERSKNAEYLKSAIGRVQYKVEGNRYTIKAKIVPEHKITKKQYPVVAVIDIEKEEIEDVYCDSITDGCKAAKGGCKHAVAFLFFLYEKYNTPSPTEGTCLWKVPQLARVEENIDNFNLAKYGRSSAASNNQSITQPGSGVFVRTLLEKCPSGQLITGLKFHQPFPRMEAYSLHCLFIDFKESYPTQNTAKKFNKYCQSTMSTSICREIEINTRGQGQGQNRSRWFQLKFGRITASKLWELSRCKTTDGSLVHSLLGQQSVTTEAMKRGLELEGKVVDVLKKCYPNVRTCGLFLDPNFPTFGASPDAINNTTVFEIKCPSKMNNRKYYVTEQGQWTDKVKSQIQLQMALTNKEKGVLVLVHPGFETCQNPSQFIHFYEEHKDVVYIKRLMKASYKFWCSNVFDKLGDRF
ncbi:uncharacterized protein LOC128741112 [Sabethes cyaneus]|uniref:uncharacterized protein LOC128741112 n=1 Tax=Sabethes cyaneus TaxID=53552 RepID=UPI00237E1FBF|nr:uncharacterized protein LOC128741112 [Sabethes cyaneus]